MEKLTDVFSDLAAFSLANEIISDDNTVTPLSIFNLQQMHLIYIGISLLFVIVGFLLYKFVLFERQVDNSRNETNYQQTFHNAS